SSRLFLRRIFCTRGSSSFIPYLILQVSQISYSLGFSSLLHSIHSISYTPIGLSSIIVCCCSSLRLDLHSRQMLNFLYTCLYWLSSKIVLTRRKCLYRSSKTP